MLQAFVAKRNFLILYISAMAVPNKKEVIVVTLNFNEFLLSVLLTIWIIKKCCHSAVVVKLAQS